MMRENTYFEECSKQADMIREENKEIMADFEKYLHDLSENVKARHIDRVDDFINHYLLFYEPNRAIDGINRLEEYFTSFHIRKGLCASPAVMKENASSIKKFYKFMADSERIKKEDYDWVCDKIRDGMEGWIEELKVYEDK